LNRR